MTKKQAIKRIKEIQHGSSGFWDFPEELKGNIAKYFYKGDWEGGDQDSFRYGFEYGEIFGLLEAFDIKMDDFYEEKL